MVDKSEIDSQGMGKGVVGNQIDECFGRGMNWPRLREECIKWRRGASRQARILLNPIFGNTYDREGCIWRTEILNWGEWSGVCNYLGRRNLHEESDPVGAS